MTLRDDLEKAIVKATDGYSDPDEHYAARLLQKHGLALLEAVRDAERYRWLRAPDTPTAEVCLVIEGDGSRFIDGNDLDAAIDAATSADEWPECSNDPQDCPENEGYGCCKNDR